MEQIGQPLRWIGNGPKLGDRCSLAFLTACAYHSWPTADDREFMEETPAVIWRGGTARASGLAKRGLPQRPRVLERL